MILVLSSWEDEHFVAVNRELTARSQKPVLIDLARFPIELHLTIGYDDDGFSASFSGAGEVIDLTSCKVAWWRRPEQFEFPEDITDPAGLRFAYGECYHAVSGLWSALGAHWVNPPSADDEASHKPYQLVVASDVGFLRPRTLITSDPDAARSFLTDLGDGRSIYKAFTGTEESWRETRSVRADEWHMLDSVRFAPVIFQEFVPAVLDIRVTVVGDDVFASSIDSSGGDYEFDYRAELGSATIQAHKLPQDVIEHCLSLTRRLGLVYGAIDLRLTPDGEYVFLEINPSGQWLFMEERTGQPITSAFCDLLVGLDQ
ncbi:MAG: MvdC/MvdD family ATP grasp protein [Actinomycetota bacterium]